MKPFIKNNKDTIQIIAIFLIITTVSVFRSLEGLAIDIIILLIILPVMKHIRDSITEVIFGEQHIIERDMGKLYKQCGWDIKVAAKRIEEYYLKSISMELLASRLNRLKHYNEILKNTLIGLMSGIMVLVFVETGLLEIFKEYYIYINNENSSKIIAFLIYYVTLAITVIIMFGSIYLTAIFIFFSPSKQKVVKKYLQDYEIDIIENKIKETIKS